MMKDMGEPRIKIVAMPSDTNPAGNIFGGWILSQIDLAGSIAARELAPTRVVTISMKEVIFKEPVFIGDIVSCYAKVVSVGNTSITTVVKVVVQRLNDGGFVECVPVTTAEVTYVSVDEQGNKKPIDSELKRLHGFVC
ncbi:acyl-CoA thioesterase [Campylobacter fetus subsp. fetus]|uniref:Acyl-CoA thioesterase n=3 Tax=Campylobacter fetus TaxID=196 RepID=A0AAE6MAY5_CAMFE|nr:acyl-CoA hydrolase [Campylobacter fetus subsp. testudinum 03-427]AHE94629.1 acyl-CoA hydrolase [Campylobacter fetus subsp. venerealis cfvi03/293]AIR79191.1 acyl-CoA hydrolase [Campylobacter fetus subsp. fetus 04/554]AIR81044.1 acyl-CoA hydrolase [Campylobacter fetus subsp. venerealis 97/608]ALV65279.1 acyl-CoA hydrolase [Campylobacter fetus subsp. testudinum Sp3]QEL45258.1 acyl-CoA thioesterase [Campylobacter fetus subsp. venerealis NCTC 10354]QYA61884.1 acyl-CoA thioesterase [Campylobacte